MTPTIRLANADDLSRLSGLRLFGLEAAVAAGTVLLAVADGGSALGAAALDGDAVTLWVAPGPPALRRSVAQALVAAALDPRPDGAGHGAAADAGAGSGSRASLASIHVRSLDTEVVERTARQFVPRLGRSAGTVIVPPRDGWIAVYDELCDRDRKAHRRLAEELSVRRGIVVVALAVEVEAVVRMLLFERGRLVDEYLSVPDYHGPLPSGEALALAVNPTLVARLTGADAGAVRAIARTATTVDELPPPDELVAELGALLGLHGAAQGYAGAVAGPGAVLISHGAGVSPG